MPGLDPVALLQVGHGAGDAQYPVVGPGGQADARDGMLHLLLGFRIELAEAAQRARRHLRVAVNTKAFQALALDIACGQNALADHGGLFRLLVLRQFLVLHGGHLDVQIDPVQQWAGYARQVALNQGRRARAVVQRVAVIAALAGMRCPFAV